MNTLKISGLAVLVVFATMSFTSAQGPPPAMSSASKPSQSKQQKFVSLDGEFTIDLPSQISGFEEVKPFNISNGGSKYTWMNAPGFFLIEYFSYKNPQAETIEQLKNNVERAAAQLSDKGATLISKTEITIEGHPAIDLKYSRAGVLYLSRTILTKNRFYALVTSWPQSETGEGRIKVLDSFRTIDGKAEIARRLEALTPKPLPQMPAVKRPKTDAEEDFLRGSVKSIVETEEYLDGTGSVGGIKNSVDKYFDVNGNLVKQVLFDYRGNPDSITVFGFIDGKRVSKSGEFMDYEYNPPPGIAPAPAVMAPAPPQSATKTEVRKASDDRYSQSLEYKYDDHNRLTEKQILNNRGDLSRKESYTYDGKNVSEVTTDKQGKITHRILRKYDDNNNLIEQTYFSTSTAYPDDETYSYRYLDFDANGNWIKREEHVKTAQYGGGTKELHLYEYRTISYY